MNKFFYYYNSLCTGASSPTAFSYDPYVTAIKDLLVSELQQVVYYIEKLRDFDVDMSEYTDKVIDFISVLIVNLDFNKESFFVIVEDLYQNKKMLEKLYISASEKVLKEPKLLNDKLEDFSTREGILKALNAREKDLVNKELEIQISKEKKILYEIIVNLVLNSCNCLIELKTLGINLQEGKDKVLELLNTTNFPSKTEAELIDIIKLFSKCNYEIMKCLYENIVAKYGPVIKTKVSKNVLKGKSILVSGSSFNDLEKILQSVKGLNINVYAHNEMIKAFQYKKFLEYQNFIAFYQNEDSNFQADFSSFEGPIYVSRNSIPKIDVIRGQVYTSAKYPSYGIAKIVDGDFSPLIKYALDSVGFQTEKKIGTLQIGYSEKEVEKSIEEIIDKLRKKEIRHIFIIGLVNQFSPNSNYLKQFILNSPTDSVIISFSNFSERENVLYVNSCFDFYIFYKILEQISESIENYEEYISIIFADCDSSTISQIFNLIYLKMKNIFLGPCCPNIINPLLLEGLQDIFKIKLISNPKEDIDSVLK